MRMEFNRFGACPSIQETHEAERKLRFLTEAERKEQYVRGFSDARDKFFIPPMSPWDKLFLVMLATILLLGIFAFGFHVGLQY